MNNNRKLVITAIIVKWYLARAEQRAQLFLRAPEVLNDPMFLQKLVECGSNGNIAKIENYYEEVIPRHNNATFKSHFRVSRIQFEGILNLIGHSNRWHKKDKNLLGGREQICLEKTLLITLWTLATPDSYRSISERFNIAKSSVYASINTVIQIILDEICPILIKWPSDVNKHTVAMGFNRYGIPKCIGAIDGCHIPIKKPSANGTDYFNRKKFYSLVLQAICTSDLMFTDVDVRWPGSVHDGRVLRTSDMYLVANELCQPDYYIIGDSAYPLKTWLLTPFKNFGNLTPQQNYYNTQLAKTRVSIENAFSLLKGRFRRLKHELHHQNVQDSVKTIVACCVLHNMCLLYNDEDIDMFIEEGRDPRHIQMIHGPYADGNEGLDTRNNCVVHLWNNRNQH